MAKKKRKMPGLNTSSTADISFMLLIFFLVTTSMDTDQGIGRTLPRAPEDEDQNNTQDVNRRNLLDIRINSNGMLMVGEDYARIEDVKEIAKRFIKNEDNDPNLPELYTKEIDLIGKHDVTEKHVISVQTDRGTPYGIYFQVQDTLVAAYTELRDELAREKFPPAKKFAQCTEEQQDAIRKVYPQKISEAEPYDYTKDGKVAQ